jgi:hypothetical protein
MLNCLGWFSQFVLLQHSCHFLHLILSSFLTFGNRTNETLQVLRNFSSLNFFKHRSRLYVTLYLMRKSAVGIVKQDHAKRVRFTPNTLHPLSFSKISVFIFRWRKF